MKRNLIVIICVFMGILILLISGNIIIVGEKIAAVTHQPWTEWAFYGVLFAVFAYLIILPLWNVHRTPTFPALSVDEAANEEQLREYGKRLLNHCNYIEGKQKRKEHEKELENKLLHANGSRAKLLRVVQDEITLRYDGNKDMGILGINAQIKEWAKTVFMVSAVSQNSRFDTISVMWLNYKMIESLVLASGFRPDNRQMFKIYRDILATALITYAFSEALTKTNAVRPFDFGDFGDSDINPVDDSTIDDFANEDNIDVDPTNADFSSQMAESDGLSIYSILRRLKIPGPVVSSAIDGTVNALMTLRIGYITRTYLQQGHQAFIGINNKRSIKRQAMKDSLIVIPSVVASGSNVIGKKASNLIIKIIKRNF